MARLVYLTLAVLVAIGISTAGGQSDSKATAKLRSITGVVKAVSASALTLEGRSNATIVIGVDSSTRVVGKGPRVGDLLYRVPARNRLIDLVKAGDRVTVTYSQSGSALNAVEVRVEKKK